MQVGGKRRVTSIRIVVFLVIAHILAGFVGSVGVCLGGVFLVCYNGQNNRASDTDSLGTKMALVPDGEHLLRDFNGMDECHASDLCIEPRKYKLGTWGGQSGYRLDGVEGRDNPLVQNPHALCTVPHSGNLVGPAELSLWTGLIVTLAHIALMTLLIIQ